MRLLAALVAGIFLSLALAAQAAPAPDGAVEGWRVLDRARVMVHVRVPPGLEAPPVLELTGADGRTERQACEGHGELCLVFETTATPVLAVLDPEGILPDADRFNNHWPRKVLVTPWPLAPPDAYVVRYFPGVTFQQGRAPIRPPDAPMLPPPPGPMAFGLGLEGQRAGEHGWQVLANLAPTLGPALDPRLALRGYLLPQPQWGLDADVGVDLQGRLNAELGTSWLLQAAPPGTAPPARQVRVALGHQAPWGAGSTGYPYGQLTVFRDDSSAWGLWSAHTLFGGLDGAWRATSEAHAAARLGTSALLRLTGALGYGGGPLSPINRVGAGLLSQDWITADGRTYARATLALPIAQGLALPLGPLATLTQIEGGVFVEGAGLVGAHQPDKAGLLLGAGAELVLVQRTVLGLPLALCAGYAVPAWEGGGGVAPWPGRLYLTTTTAAFPLAPKSR